VTLAHATRHQFLTQRLLHYLDDERYSFCSLTAVKMDHGKPTMGRQLESLVTMAVATSSGASALETAQGSGGDGRGSSSKQWLVMGSLDAVGRWVQQAWAVARF
jgi:hypothetical protein